MWQDKKVPRRPHLPTHVVTPWETRQLMWDQRRKICGLRKPIEDISGTSDEDDSPDEKGNELLEEDGRDAHARQPATPIS